MAQSAGLCEGCTNTPATFIVTFKVMSPRGSYDQVFVVCQECLHDAESSILAGCNRTEMGLELKLVSTERI